MISAKKLIIKNERCISHSCEIQRFMHKIKLFKERE